MSFAEYLEAGNHISPGAARDETAVRLFLGSLLDLSEAFITLSWDSPRMARQCKWSPKITDTSKCMTFTMHSLSESLQFFEAHLAVTMPVCEVLIINAKWSLPVTGGQESG